MLLELILTSKRVAPENIVFNRVVFINWQNNRDKSDHTVLCPQYQKPNLNEQITEFCSLLRDICVYLNLVVHLLCAFGTDGVGCKPLSEATRSISSGPGIDTTNPEHVEVLQQATEEIKPVQHVCSLIFLRDPVFTVNLYSSLTISLFMANGIKFYWWMVENQSIG